MKVCQCAAPTIGIELGHAFQYSPDSLMAIQVTIPLPLPKNEVNKSRVEKRTDASSE